MNQSEIKTALVTIQRAIFWPSDPVAEAEAVAQLNALAEQELPVAMTQLGELLWHGIAVDSDVDRAFSLIRQAAEDGFSEAMISLGAMYLVGAGCPQSFDRALYWYQQRQATENQSSDVITGPSTLSEYKFRLAFALDINGQRWTARLPLLERINLWQVEARLKTVAKQSAMLDRNSDAFAGTSKRLLPFAGASGDALDIILAGPGELTKVGLHNGWINETFWFDLAEMDGPYEPPSLGTLTAIGTASPDIVHGIRMAYCRKVRWHRSGANALLRLVRGRSSEKTLWFELHLGRSSVSIESKLLCGGETLYSRLEC